MSPGSPLKLLFPLTLVNNVDFYGTDNRDMTDIHGGMNKRQGTVCCSNAMVFVEGAYI